MNFNCRSCEVMWKLVDLMSSLLGSRSKGQVKVAEVQRFELFRLPLCCALRQKKSLYLYIHLSFHQFVSGEGSTPFRFIVEADRSYM